MPRIPGHIRATIFCIILTNLLLHTEYFFPLQHGLTFHSQQAFLVLTLQTNCQDSDILSIHPALRTFLFALQHLLLLCHTMYSLIFDKRLRIVFLIMPSLIRLLQCIIVRFFSISYRLLNTDILTNKIPAPI